MPRVQVRSGQLPALSTVQTRRAIRKEELGSNVIATVANKYAQVVWQEDDDGIPELIKAMKTAKGMKD